jgi:hypothetical protein
LNNFAAGHQLYAARNAPNHPFDNPKIGSR